MSAKLKKRNGINTQGGSSESRDFYLDTGPYGVDRQVRKQADELGEPRNEKGEDQLHLFSLDMLVDVMGDSLEADVVYGHVHEGRDEGSWESQLDASKQAHAIIFYG